MKNVFYKYSDYIFAFIVIILVTLLCIRCVDKIDTKVDKTFTLIKEDKSNTLSVDSDYKYYYLNDTKIVYVGYIRDNASVNTSSRNFCSPVISENGNYYKYDLKGKCVIEVR